ncbi:cip1-interacting zinc finger protein isoform X3 [Scophthalmus maximus]|uniref:cip1-interacting zinc finger protein isoform X3 n=1 Tax=Scophthalmus maximus TaxID=52904 RepID=UPI0015E108D7|nr:cip1-interacting zinc finger protein isoform X3 [Scophthalmus maximus]
MKRSVFAPEAAPPLTSVTARTHDTCSAPLAGTSRCFLNHRASETSARNGQRSEVIMGKRQRRTNRRFLPAAGNSVAQVRFPVGPVQRRPPPQGLGRKWAGSGPGSADGRQLFCGSSTTTEEERGDPGPDGGSGETKKRTRLDGSVTVLPAESCDPAPNESSSTGGGVPPPDQQKAAELSDDSRAAELQSVGSLKVTIQRSSESREFVQTDRTTDRQTVGVHCHVCHLTYRSVQVFHEHMSGAEHMKKMQEITHSICFKTHTLQDRGRQPQAQRWCDTCQTHFSGDVIIHRRTKQHKICKQLCRPFCPVCKRHFRTPRKFVEHMKSPEHKQQVQLQQAQEEELITVDAVGCFEEEEEVADDEEGYAAKEEAEEKVLQVGLNDESSSNGNCDLKQRDLE